MSRQPLFFDDREVERLIDEAANAAMHPLRRLQPNLTPELADQYAQRLREHIAALVRGDLAAVHKPPLPALVLGPDAFGDPFDLEALPLPRAGTGYAVQYLDTDTLLDRHSARFLPVRHPDLDALHESFASAYAAARAWVAANNLETNDIPLAIIPASYDLNMKRHVLIFGVVNRSP